MPPVALAQGVVYRLTPRCNGEQYLARPRSRTAGAVWTGDSWRALTRTLNEDTSA